jgi:hypothetical protein
MKNIRQGVFETNSSSTHAICVSINQETEIPKSLHFEFNEFGWEYRELRSMEQKASYLYTGLFHNEREEDIKNIVFTLQNMGIEVTCEEPAFNDDSKYPYNCGYIDHDDGLREFLDAICGSEEQLTQFLFSPFSYILTGNDNNGPGSDDEGIKITAPYSYHSYYKGN